MDIKKFWMVLAIALVSLCTMSCGGGDDDDDVVYDGGGKSSKNVLVGEWRQDWDTGGWQTLTFNSNGTGAFNSTMDDMMYAWANGSFRYTVVTTSGSSGYVQYTFTSGLSKGNSYTVQYSVSGSMLTFNGQAYYKSR